MIKTDPELKESFETDDIPGQQDFENLIDSKINVGQKGAANGIARLDASKKIPLSNIPTSVIGGMKFKGFWNADADMVESEDEDINGEELDTPVTANNSWMFIVKVGAVVTRPDFDGAPITVNKGDAIISNGITWGIIGTYQTVDSVNGKIGIIVLTKEDIGLGFVPNIDTTNASNIDSGILADARLSNNITKEGNIFNGADQLVKTDGNGKILSSLIPGLAIGDTFFAEDEEEMLALGEGDPPAEKGDICIRTDQNKTYRLIEDDPSDIDNWALLLSPGQVVSVNGYTGIVVLNKSDIGLSNVPNVDTTNASNISSGTLAAGRISDEILRVVGQLCAIIDLQGGGVSDYSKSNLYLSDSEATMGFGLEGGVTKNGFTAFADAVRMVFNGVSLVEVNAGVFRVGGNASTKSYFEINISTGATKFVSDDGVGLKYNADYSAGYTARTLIDKGYLDATITALKNGADAAYDTFRELQEILEDEDDAIAALVTSVAGKAPLVGSLALIASAANIDLAVEASNTVDYVGGNTAANSSPKEVIIELAANDTYVAPASSYLPGQIEFEITAAGADGDSITISSLSSSYVKLNGDDEEDVAAGIAASLTANGFPASNTGAVVTCDIGNYGGSTGYAVNGMVVNFELTGALTTNIPSDTIEGARDAVDIKYDETQLKSYTDLLSRLEQLSYSPKKYMRLSFSDFVISETGELLLDVAVALGAQFRVNIYFFGIRKSA